MSDIGRIKGSLRLVVGDTDIDLGYVSLPLNILKVKPDTVRSSEEIWEERRSLARDRAKKIIQNLIDVGEEDSPILEVGDCGQSMIQCLIELESDRSDRLVGSSYNSGYVDGWESALDTLRSILIGHGINLKEE